LKSNNNHHLRPSKKNLNRKRTKNVNQYKSNDSIDSDIERFSSPLSLHKGTSNNSTILFSPDHNQPNLNSTNIDNTIDIDQRLKILEKFITKNFPH